MEPTYQFADREHREATHHAQVPNASHTTALGDQQSGQPADALRRAVLHACHLGTADIIALQRSVGNAAVSQLLKGYTPTHPAPARAYEVIQRNGLEELGKKGAMPLTGGTLWDPSKSTAFGTALYKQKHKLVSTASTKLDQPGFKAIRETTEAFVEKAAKAGERARAWIIFMDEKRGKFKLVIAGSHGQALQYAAATNTKKLEKYKDNEEKGKANAEYVPLAAGDIFYKPTDTGYRLQIRNKTGTFRANAEFERLQLSIDFFRRVLPQELLAAGKVEARRMRYDGEKEMPEESGDVTVLAPLAPSGEEKEKTVVPAPARTMTTGMPIQETAPPPTLPLTLEADVTPQLLPLLPQSQQSTATDRGPISTTEEQATTRPSEREGPSALTTPSLSSSSSRPTLTSSGHKRVATEVAEESDSDSSGEPESKKQTREEAPSMPTDE